MKFIRLASCLFIFFISSSTFSSTALSGCLAPLKQHEHRIDKEQIIRVCFDKHKSSLDKKNCYSSISKDMIKLNSSKLLEDLKSTCFYETTPSNDIGSCLKETQYFKNTLNHDEAVFYCFQQFQEKLSKNDCLKTAEQMVYPLKKEYLRQYCSDSNNY